MHWLRRHGLRVLMYHKVSPHRADALTVTREQLGQQLAWLRERAFQFIALSDVARSLGAGQPLPDNSVLVTFDDAYRDTYELAWPLLREHRVPAAVFVPTAYIGGMSSWDADAEPLMNEHQLAELSRGGIELGLHSHRHRDFSTAARGEAAHDLQQARAAMFSHGLPFVPALAYPYGRRPRGRDSGPFRQELASAGVRLAFRIGNRINRLPLQEPFDINRLDVRGDRSFAFFRRKIWWGRWW